MYDRPTNEKLNELRTHFDADLATELRCRVNELINEFHYELPCGTMSMENVLNNLDVVAAIADAVVAVE